MLQKEMQFFSGIFLQSFHFRNKSATLRYLARRHFALNSVKRDDKASYYHHIGRHPLVYRTVGEELERVANDFGSTEAIISCHEEKRHTFGELLIVVDQLAAGFLRVGLKRGDHVAIWGPNNMQWYLTMLACARAGLVSVGINPAFQRPEVEYCLRKINVKAIVAPESFKTQNYYETLQMLCPELATSAAGNLMNMQLPHLRTVIIDSQSQLPGAYSFDQLLDFGNREELRAIGSQQKRISPDAACNVQFTSGTTGQPKAAVLSHYNFVNNGIHIGNRNQYRGQRICVQVPFFHVFGAVISIMGGLSYGATLVLPAPSFNAEASLQSIINERCTVIHGTPTMYVDLIKKQRELQLPLKTAKRAITGGAICSPALFRDIKEVLGLEEVRTVFGMTETTAVIFQSRSGDTEEQILDTVGHVQDHIEVKVIDAMGKVLPCGQPGELCVRGYLTMLGYHSEAQQTREIIGADKWLHTGDQFILEANGYGRIVGRLKDVIIRGGENLFPKEIENFISEHPDIIEAHVVGVPDERMGEEICAFVRLRAGVAGLTREQLKEYSKGKFAHFKVPRYVMVVNEFPKTLSGKVQKYKLRAIFEKQRTNTT